MRRLKIENSLEKRQLIRHRVSVIEKLCHKCGIIKNFQDFAKNPRNSDGLHVWCKDCSNSERRAKNYHKKSNLLRKSRIKTDLDYRNYLAQQKLIWSHNNLITLLVARAKKRALTKGLEFNLTKEDVIIPDLCPILKVKFIRGSYMEYEYTPSIDRIDNTKGYTKDNIQIITKKANSMKNSGSPEELLLLADWIIKTYKRDSPIIKE